MVILTHSVPSLTKVCGNPCTFLLLVSCLKSGLDNTTKQYHGFEKQSTFLLNIIVFKLAMTKWKQSMCHNSLSIHLKRNVVFSFIFIFQSWLQHEEEVSGNRFVQGRSYKFLIDRVGDNINHRTLCELTSVYSI